MIRTIAKTLASTQVPSERQPGVSQEDTEDAFTRAIFRTIEARRTTTAIKWLLWFGTGYLLFIGVPAVILGAH